jgi:putative transposase
VRPLLDRVARFSDLLELGDEGPEVATLRAAETIGRPVGSAAFLDRLSRRLGRPVAPRKRGRKPMHKADE